MRVVVLFVTALLLGACAGTPGLAARPPSAQAGPADRPDALPLALPASFEGTLPCADCAGIRYHLDLWPDGVFHLRREWLGTDGVAVDLGRWQETPGRSAIALYGGTEETLGFAVVDADTLRLLDRQGQPIESSLPYTLQSLGTLQPLVLSRPLHGMFTYMADAPRFQECLTGRSYPVAMAGGYLSLERAYVDADKPAAGAPIMAYVDGEIGPAPAMEGDALVPTLSVERFVGLFPQQSCDRARSTATLSNTYWRFVSLAEQPVAVETGQREPHLLLRSGRPEFAATVGCNRVGGSYRADREGLWLQPGAMTRMACPPPLDTLEDRLIAALDAVRSWRLHAQVLELFDADGGRVALLEAVYLP